MFDANTTRSSARASLWSKDLRQRQNASRARLKITNFPTELLRHIFSYFPPFFTEEAREACTFKHTPHGFNVCRRWRAIVRGMPHFWTVIPLKYPFWADIALMYSRRASICIDVELDLAIEKPVYFQTVLRALQDTHRARRLTFRLPEADGGCDEIDDPSDILKCIVRILTTLSAPRLQEFHFTDNPDLEQYLPLDLFRGEPLPLLRNLELENCNVRHDSNLLSAPLTTLRLLGTGITWPDEKFGDVLDYVTILSNLPNLQILTVQDPPFGAPRDEMESSPQVSLPRLESFQFMGEVPVVTDFVQFMLLPHGAKRVITCSDTLDSALDELDLEGTAEDALEIASLTSAFLRHFAPAIDAGVSFQRVCLDLQYGASVDCFVLTASPPQQPASDSLAVNPFIFEMCASPDRADYMAKMFSTLPPCFNDVHSLRVLDEQCDITSHSTQRLQHIWPLLDERLPQVTEIIAQGHAALDLLSYLALDRDGELFRKLRKLTLHVIDLSSVLDLKALLQPVSAYSSDDPKPTVFHCLQVWLSRRREAGDMIELTIDCCNLTQKMQQQLEEVGAVLRRIIPEWEYPSI
ncbi:hypothetical protein BV25DRAFT_1841256 [Artomyces pyxidatus]|uniref:Uncharacterized protein n=1 Tax=Artomyces pyxidatus TaxID=48021 RepID=A0ACB8SQB8_9AGAM|nr:hypothetical protein BV25DRAFT_1841256 [Artomyces pyxidatus]